MSVTRLLIVSALLGTPLLSPVVGEMGIAHAQDAVFDAPVFYALSGAAIPGDGSTQTSMYVVALDTDGSALSGVTGRVVVSDGTAGAIEEVEAGLYRVQWTPPAVTSTTSVDVSLRARLPSRASANPTFSVNVTPPTTGAIQITANPAEVVLGQDTSVTLTMQLGDNTSASFDGVALDVRASAGTITNLTHLGGGQFSAMYTPPNRPYPHVAVLTVVDKRNPSETYGTFALPLVGKANFPVTTIPNSRAMVRINDRDFGPVQADAAGRASVPIVVPPGYGTGTLITIVGEEKTEETLDLQLPVTPRIEMFAIDASIPADPTMSIPVRVAVVQGTGEPDTAADVRFSSTAGEMSDARHVGGGVYEADFSPPYGNASSQATITVTLNDPQGEQTGSITLNLIPARPASVSLSAEPPTLTPQAASFQLFSKVIGQNGIGISGRQPRYFANGARIAGGSNDLGNGDYKTRFSSNNEGSAEVTAVVLGDAGTNPLAHVLVIPARQQIGNDGASTTPVTVLTVDRFGYPVPNVTLTMRADQGGGTLPTTVTTDTAGVANFNYTAGQDTGLATLTATAGAISGGGSLLQLPGDPTVPAALPISGDASSVAMYQAWQQSIAYLRVEREGAERLVINPDVSNRAGPLSRIQVTPEPATVAAGGTITLRIRAEDAQGRGKAGQRFDFAATVGTTGAVTDLGGGDYSVPLVVPPDAAEGEAKVTVASEDGEVVGFVKIPVTAPTVAASWGSAAAAEPAAEPVAAAEPAAEPEPERTRPPREPRPPRTPGDEPWLRAFAGYRGGLYGYNQQPLTNTSPLYDQSVTFGGGTSAASAGSTGLDLRGRAFLPSVPYVGVDTNFSTLRYAVTIPAFSEPVVDFVNEFNLQMVGRYPVSFNGGQAHIGARLGGGFEDLILYKQMVESGQRLLTYEQMLLGALNVGGEAAVDIGDLFVIGNLDVGLAQASIYYRLEYNLAVGYSFTDSLFAHLGAGYFQRNTELYNEADTKIGELQDKATVFTVGVGYQR